MSALAEKVGGLFSEALPPFFQGVGELAAVIYKNFFLPTPPIAHYLGEKESNTLR